MEYVCEYCSKRFSKSFNLKRHISAMHSSPSIKSGKTDRFICQFCSRSYIYKRSLFAHLKICQSIDRKPQLFYYSCCLCKAIDIQHILEHYSVEHNLDLSVLKLAFDTQQEFNSWKDDIEKSTISKYIQNCKREYTYKVMYYYRCHRNGYHKSKSKNIRNIKRLGSSKINGYCPSKITATICNKTGRVTVDYIPTHVGHTMDLRRIPLKKAERDILAAKISQKIPFDTILQDIRRDNVAENNCNRLHLLTRQDLVNIEKSFNLNNESVRHSKTEIRKSKSTSIENNSSSYESAFNHNIVEVVDREVEQEEEHEEGEHVEGEHKEQVEEHEEEEQADSCILELWTQEACESDTIAAPDIINSVKKRLINQFHNVISMAATLEQCALIESVLFPLESEIADMVSTTTNLNATKEV